MGDRIQMDVSESVSESTATLISFCIIYGYFHATVVD